MDQRNNVFQIKYNNFKNSLEELQERVIQLGHEKEEHEVVLKTLKDSESDRKVYRMVGGALVETNVKDSIPILTTKKDNLNKTIEQLKMQLVKTAQDFEKWKKDNKIQVVQQ
ncbi:hypothetical protein TBLA_0J01730 [Henningerozyma blattae CBS 6284]|uniref:Prefoldin subunit 2 n=1 Tax=Henningerozyma blattae (strain ATCC 34711 / CBS 6284 / DSM 70876 / NBRC 10599 / NRRL Y-10934 / UCD 77-7) TaxID=1071380 RepID=I2H9W5_HENB6|nr:hypothetical protein TBLA_0J01730 [Tetrapisispora blattae CBS 6284]CCH63167.1 hypothetical protein TBLA_0J01730 [Tetrapisispora blattae CBS 6284]